MIADGYRVPNPRELLNLLLGSTPAYLAGTFRTVSQDDRNEVYESGTFLYFDGDYWDVNFDHGQRWILAPDRMAVVYQNGRKELVSGHRAKPSRPPWSHVQPRTSGLLAQKPGDDWQLDAGEPFVADQSGLHARLINLEEPHRTAQILIDQQFWCVLKVELPSETQTISIDRSVTPEAAAKRLEAIKEILELP